MDLNKTDKSKRLFLKNLALGSLFIASSPAIAKASFFKEERNKGLSFINTHTGDTLNLVYYEQGLYIPDALKEINFVMRDFRTDDTFPIDLALLDQLYDLKQLLGTNKPFHIISGYRSPKTNAMLRKHSHGVAQKSLHMLGKAIDIRLPGLDSRIVRSAALKLRQGGVGYYRSSNFVHLDTGRFRTW